MTELNALADRCEKEAAGSRELDAEIFQAVTGLSAFHSSPGYSEGRTLRKMIQGLPHYTTSLDAALTLVPEGMKIDLIRRDNGTGYACIWTPRGNRSNSAATPALALCAAALRALAATE